MDIKSECQCLSEKYRISQQQQQQQHQKQWLRRQLILRAGGRSPMPIYSETGRHPAPVSADFKAAIWRRRPCSAGPWRRVVGRDAPARLADDDAAARPPRGLKCIADIAVRRPMTVKRRPI